MALGTCFWVTEVHCIALAEVVSTETASHNEKNRIKDVCELECEDGLHKYQEAYQPADEMQSPVVLILVSFHPLRHWILGTFCIWFLLVQILVEISVHKSYYNV